ncbi:MAG: oxidoreductase [Flavobacteriaceae bacterium]|nr:oxidoreductase [Flavobacteriaceae bacterium]
MNRKNFIKKTALITSAGLLTHSPIAFGNPYKIIGSNEKIKFGTIGLNNMGWHDSMRLLRVPNVELVAICDVDKNILKKRSYELKKSGIKVKEFSDYRNLLDDSEIDAIIIGSPDHWHPLMMIHASEAGKHVYCEKPIGNSIGECNAMVKAQERYGNIVQVGQWQRSMQHFKDAVNFISTGVLGNIRTVKTWCYTSFLPLRIVPDSSPPIGVNYKSWLGPAPLRPFNASRFHGHFRWFWDYAGGLMTDWGVHLLDYALLGMNCSYPKSVIASGGKFASPDLAEETPDTLFAIYEFDDFNLIWDSAQGIKNGPYGLNHGIAFIGNHGTLVLNRRGWKVIEEKNNKNKITKPFVKKNDNGLDNHLLNFIEAIRANDPKKVNCSISDGALVAKIAHMGNISYRSGEKLFWDATSDIFTNNTVNENYITNKYHNGYNLQLY